MTDGSSKDGGDANIVDSLKEAWENRLRHPLVLSFLLSWCVSNWEVVVAAYDGSEQFSRAYAIQVAIDTQTRWEMYGKPLLAAVFITFLLPLLDVAIQELRGWVRTTKAWVDARALERSASDTERAARARVAREFWNDLTARSLIKDLASNLDSLGEAVENYQSTEDQRETTTDRLATDLATYNARSSHLAQILNDHPVPDAKKSQDAKELLRQAGGAVRSMHRNAETAMKLQEPLRLHANGILQARSELTQLAKHFPSLEERLDSVRVVQAQNVLPATRQIDG